METLEVFNALSEVKDTEVQKFHDSRLLFIVIGNKAFTERVPSGLSHIDWIKTLDLSEVINPYNQLDAVKDANYILDNFVRGYLNNNKLVFYKGVNFDCSGAVIDVIRYNLNAVLESFNINKNVNICAGVIPVPNQVFEIEHNLGIASELTDTKLDEVLKKIRQV